MKFLVQHRQDILKSIEECGFSEEDFSFVKKKGRIHTIHQPSKSHFAYLRVKNTQINDQSLQWEHTEYFKVQYNQESETITPDWTAVLQGFMKWLKTLPT